MNAGKYVENVIKRKDVTILMEIVPMVAMKVSKENYATRVSQLCSFICKSDVSDLRDIPFIEMTKSFSYFRAQTKMKPLFNVSEPYNDSHVIMILNDFAIVSKMISS